MVYRYREVDQILSVGVPVDVAEEAGNTVLIVAAQQAHARMHTCTHACSHATHAYTHARTHARMNACTYARMQGHMDLCELALSCGADINTKNKRGNTGLHYCVSYGYKQCAEFLMTKGTALPAHTLVRMHTRTYAHSNALG